MDAERPLSAEEIRRELERTYNSDARATLIRGACQLQNAGQWEGDIPPLHQAPPPLPRRERPQT